MEASIGVELPTKDSHGPYMTDVLAYHWATFILKEQCELLQLLLLYYKDIEPTISDVQKMLLLFQDHGFGLRQSFHMSTLEGTQPFVNLIGFLESFVIVQCFELDWFYKCKESQMIGEHYLLKDMQALKMLNDSILNLGSNQSHAPILLAWLAIAQGSEVPDMMMHCNKLGKLALHLGVFEYLVTALSAFSEKTVVSEVANGVVYSLLSAVLSEFDLQHLGSIRTLCTIACAVLQFPSVADNFWKRGTESGTGELFNYCMEMFAIEFCPFLNICASLARASEDSCLKVIERIKCLPVFTEYLENVDERDIIATQEPCVWQSIKSKPVYGDNSLLIPEGTFGAVVKDADKNGASIIQWKVTVNGWQICLRELHIKLQEMSFSLAFPAPESVQRIEAVGTLVLNILKTNSEMRFHLSHLINVLFSIFQR
ncbi:Nucleoporin NUP188-like protein, partial [Stegodyphus mimosarum]